MEKIKDFKGFEELFGFKNMRKSLVLGLVFLFVLSSSLLILSEPASATKFVPKTTLEMFDEADVIVNGIVVSIEDEVACYPGIRRITIDVTGTEKGSTPDTISIIQLNSVGDPTQIYPYNAVFSLDEDVRVHLIDISDVGFIYDWDGINTVPIPAGDNYWVHQGYNGKEPFQIPPVNIESVLGDSCCSEVPSSNERKKCCILLDFAADAFDDGYKNGGGKDLKFTDAQKTQIKDTVLAKVKADYTIPNCPIVVTTKPADCKDATFQVTVKIGGNSGNKKIVDANGTRTTDDSFGFAPDSKPGNGCITSKNVYVYTQEFGFEDGKEDWADTVGEMAQAVANVAAHEAGHQLGLSHDKDNDMPNGDYNNDDRPDGNIMVNGQDVMSKLGTVNQKFTACDIAKIKECCCPIAIPEPVEQCDQETTFVLYESNATIVKTIHGYVYVDMEPDVNGVGQDIITAGDIRLSNWHTNYAPNTKVMPEDMDNLDVIDYKYTAPITYVDVNDNQMYDLYDGVVYDFDDDGFVSVGDILQTDIPAVDVYSLDEFNAGEFVMAQGEYGQAWDRVNAAHPAKGMELTKIGDGVTGITAGVAAELIKWVDADDSNDWSCEDKLYLIQPHDENVDKFDKFVTIGDTRVYIPEGDECIPECGTKVVQGDQDATYILMKTVNAQLAYYSFGAETEWYVDMDADHFVSFGDIRLTEVSEHYGPNTKVKICDEFDLGHDLTWAGENADALSDQTAVRYAETDGLLGYTLGDRVYVDINDYSPDGIGNYVEAGDIRLVEAEVYLPGFVNPFVYDAWSVVESNDADVGDRLFGLLDDNGIGEGEDYAPLNDYLGYIDTDCTATWTCPDKLYIQQMVADHENRLWFYDDAVTVGDLRLYVPVNDPNSPFFGMEDWPECGTKVTCADIDVEYAVTEVFTNYDFIKFVDRNNDGLFTEGVDHVYIDMDNSSDVTVGDVRLTDVSIKNDTYANNTKVDDHDLDRAGTMLPADLYVTVSDEDLLAVVPYVAGYGPADPTVELPTESFNFTVSMFDNDCSGDWTCVDALYLSIDDQFWMDDLAVTHKDIRLYIPPGLICDGEVPNGECDYHAYDANQDGMISIGEVNTAIDDYRTQGPTSIADVSELIDMYRTGEPYC